MKKHKFMVLLKRQSFIRETGLTDRLSYLEYLKNIHPLNYIQEQELEKLKQNGNNKSRRNKPPQIL
jgi:hypothetical protein